MTMHTLSTLRTTLSRAAITSSALLALLAPSVAQASEADLKLPNLRSVSFFGIDGWTLLALGLVICVAGLAFGFLQYNTLKNLPVHRAMREISELIYETCKTYLVTQGKFILILEVFIGAIMVVYFGVLQHMEASRVITVLLWLSLIHI